LEILHWYGGAPPVAESAAVYRVLVLPAGSAEFAIAKAAWGVTVTVAAACTLGFAVLVAVMVAEVLVVTLGATKTPLLEIVPTLADHITPVSAVPLIWAVNCSWACEVRVALLGEIESLGSEAPAATTICADLDPDSVCRLRVSMHRR
jgi:hypothetical protein